MSSNVVMRYDIAVYSIIYKRYYNQSFKVYDLVASIDCASNVHVANDSIEHILTQYSKLERINLADCIQVTDDSRTVLLTEHLKRCSMSCYPMHHLINTCKQTIKRG
jgi:hypothetical protein